MKLIQTCLKAAFSVFAICIAFLAAAGSQPKFSLTPTTSTTFNFKQNDPSVVISYLVTNNTSIARTLTMVAIPGINQIVAPGTCSNPFTLQPGFSCFLSLFVDPSALPDKISGGPEVCKTNGPGNNTPDPFLCSQACGAAALNLRSVKLTSITVTPANATIFTGQTIQYTATAHYSDGSTANLTTTATWSSSNAGAATISNTPGTKGQATGTAALGTVATTTITATQDGISGSTTLTVSDLIASIVVTPANPTVNHGSTQQFLAEATFQDGSMQDITNVVVWSSSNTTVATISNTSGSQGLASALSQGVTTIKATFGTVSGQTTMTVNGALAYVVDGGGNQNVEICPVDSTTGAVGTCVSSGAPAFPFDIEGLAFNANGTFAYVGSEGANVLNSCIVIAGTGKFGTCTSFGPVAALNDPRGIAVNAAGTIAYVVNFSGNNVANCTITGGVITACATITTPPNPPSAANLNQPNSIALSPNGLYAYITSINGSGSLTACSVTGGGGLNNCSIQSAATGFIGNQPLTVITNAAGNLLYIVNAFPPGSQPEVTKCIADPLTGAVLVCSSTINPNDGSVHYGMALNSNESFAYIVNQTQDSILQCPIAAGGNLGTCVSYGSIGLGVARTMVLR